MRAKISHVCSLSLAFVLSLALLLPSQVSALDLTRDVQLQGNASYYFMGLYADPNNYSLLDNNRCIRATGIAAFTQMSMTWDSGAISVQAGDFTQVWFSIGINAENNSSDTMIRGLQLTSYFQGYFDIIQLDFQEVNPSNGIIKIILRAKQNINLSIISFSAPNPFMVLYNNEFIYSGTITNWRPFAQASNQDIINAINNQTDYSSQLNQLHNDIGGLRGAQEQANDDANDRYEDEKNTINDSVDGASDEADTMDTSGFTFGNPLATWFGMFSNNQCVSIPKLKSWLHGTESQVCTPWSSDVRSNLTPVASVLSIMVAFGLLIHWLKGDSDVGLENT